MNRKGRRQNTKEMKIRRNQITKVQGSGWYHAKIWTGSAVSRVSYKANLQSVIKNKLEYSMGYDYEKEENYFVERYKIAWPV